MIRKEAKESFTWVHNTFIRDKRLSLAERGMLLLLISLPNDWSFSIAGIKAMVQDGREKVSSTLKALEEHGYLRRVQRYDENGAFTDLLYSFSDEPVFLDDAHKPGDENFTKVSEESAEKADFMPMTENPHTAPTDTSNPSNINNYNNKILIYESTTKEIMCCEAAQREAEAEVKPENKLSKPKKAKKSIDTAVYEAIVTYLNEKAHTNYKHTTAATRRLIDARIKEGHSVEDFKTVIDRKSAEWMGSGMAQYLRPHTLFGTKFESYLNAPDYTANFNSYGKQNGQNTQDVPKDYSTDMIDLLNEYLGE